MNFQFTYLVSDIDLSEENLSQASYSQGRFTLRWRRPPVGQECLAKTWLYEANGGCAGEELKAIKYFLLSWASPAS